MKRPSILVVADTLNCGGTETHLLNVFSRLKEGPYDITIIPLMRGGQLEESFKQSMLLTCGTSTILFVNLAKIIYLIVSKRPIIHLFLPRPYIVVGLLSYILPPCPLIYSRRSRNYYQRRHPIMAFVERQLHSHVSVATGNSISVCNDLLGEGVDKAKLQLLYNGVALPTPSCLANRRVNRDRLTSELGISDTRILVVCVANFFSYKGHLDLIEALSILGTSFTTYASLLLVGRDAGSLSSVKSSIAIHNLQGLVHLLGPRDDVPDLLTACDVGVLPSHQEGFSNSVLEGMAFGLPMVVTDVGGNSEAVIDGESGLIVPPRSPIDLARALGQLIADSCLRRKLGLAAQRRIQSTFSLDRCVNSYISLYESLFR